MSEQPKRIAKRFIAGAVCPACNAMDSIKMWDEGGVPHRECIACDYSDTLNEHGHAVPKELDTRVNRLAPPSGPALQSIQFFPNPKLKKLH